MSMGNQYDTEVRIGGDASGATTAMRQASTAVADGVKNIQGAMEGITSMVNKVNLAFAALAAGGAFREFVQSFTDEATDVGKLASRLTMTTQEASHLNVALKLIGSSADDYLHITSQLNRQLRTNADRMAELGLTTIDAAGKQKTQQEVMQGALGVLEQYKSGYDRNMVSMEMFGRGADEVQRYLKLNNELMANAAELAKAFGNEFEKEAIAQTKEFKVGLNTVGFALEQFGQVIGEEAMPRLMALADAIKTDGPAAFAVFRQVIAALFNVLDSLKGALTGLLGVVYDVFAGIADTIRTVLGESTEDLDMFANVLTVIEIAAEAFKTGLLTVFTVIGAAISSMVDAAAMMGRALAAAMRLDFDGAKKAWDDYGRAVEDRAEKTLAKLTKIAEEGGAKMAALAAGTSGGGAGGQNESPAASGQGGTRTYTPKDQNVSKDSRLKNWEAELDEAKLAIAEMSNASGTFRQMQLEDEAAYWEHILENERLNTDERIAIRKKVAAANLAINKQQFDAHQAELRNQLEALRANYAERITLAQEMYDATVQRYGAESAEAKKAYAAILDERRKLEQQQNALYLRGVDSRAAAGLAAIDLERTQADMEVELGKLAAADRLALEREFEDRRFDIQRDALLERQALIDPARDPEAYAAASARLEELERQHQQRMAEIRRQQTVAASKDVREMQGSILQGVQGIIASIGTSIKSLGDLWRAMWQTSLSVAMQFMAKMLTEWIATKLGWKAVEKASAISQVAENAAIAGAAGTASWAAAPWPINVGAPAFGAAMSAAAMGFMPVAASAAGGYDIPPGVNPVTQLHEEEMVLPAKYANLLRGLSESGGAQGGGDNIAVTIHAVDAQSVKRLLLDNPAALGAAIKNAKRHNAI